MKKLFLVLALLGILLLGCAGTTTQQSNTSNTTGTNQTAKIMNTNSGIEQGDIVELDYVGSFENGTVFDTSLEQEAVKAGLTAQHAYGPISFTPGEHKLINGIEDGVLGMKEGEESNLVIKPEDAYGLVREDFVVETNKSSIKSSGENITLGSRIMASNGLVGIVKNESNETVTIDFNHPLAGETLHFKLIIRKIVKAG